MPFRLVGTHQHRAVIGPSTFLCVRRETAVEAGIAFLWIASRNGVVLKDDCRTLNEAKNLCRQVSAEERLIAPPPRPSARSGVTGAPALPDPGVGEVNGSRRKLATSSRPSVKTLVATAR